MRERIIRTTLVLGAVGLAAGLMVGPANGGEGKPDPVPVPGGIPLVVVDEAAGDWVVDRFAGNSTAGYAFSQGPAPEAGGIGWPVVAVAPDGNVYLATGDLSWVKDIVVRISPDGTLRLLAGGESSLDDGPAARARIAVDWRGGGLAWSKRDNSLYFVHATVPADMVRRLDADAGVHLYTDRSDFLVFGDAHYLMLAAPEDGGECKVFLPKACTVKDLATDAVLCRTAPSLSISFRPKEVRLFFLE